MSIVCSITTLTHIFSLCKCMRVCAVCVFSLSLSMSLSHFLRNVRDELVKRVPSSHVVNHRIDRLVLASNRRLTGAPVKMGDEIDQQVHARVQQKTDCGPALDRVGCEDVHEKGLGGEQDGVETVLVPDHCRSLRLPSTRHAELDRGGREEQVHQHRDPVERAAVQAQRTVPGV